LVNFEYLNRMMENYGFVLLTKDECNEIGIPSSVGSFQQLYGLMEQEINKFPKKRNDYGAAFKMTSKEKQISFYNNYFIYKKIRNVDTRAVYNTMVGSSKFQEQLNKEEEDLDKDVAEIEKQTNVVKAPKKLKKRILLVQTSKDSVESVEDNKDTNKSNKSSSKKNTTKTNTNNTKKNSK